MSGFYKDAVDYSNKREVKEIKTKDTIQIATERIAQLFAENIGNENYIYHGKKGLNIVFSYTTYRYHATNITGQTYYDMGYKSLKELLYTYHEYL